MKGSLFAELKARGLLNQWSEGCEEALTTSSQKIYCGFDPTAPSLHVGSLAPLMLLIHSARYGHTPVVVIGGGTALIGDPSGKDRERPLLPEEQIEQNSIELEKQIREILQRAVPFSCPVFVNNREWLGNLRVIPFLRDIGKHIQMNYMLDKDSVRQRLQKGLSFTEFSYMLLQAYDFYYLFKTAGCKVQCGGADQWGNITAGIELIRRLTGQPAYGFTTPLLMRSDGSKFGKTESGENVWLSPHLTKPYLFYQFFVNLSDEEALTLLRRLTLLSLEEIEEISQKHKQQPEQRLAQRTIAYELTALVHGKEAAERSRLVSSVIFYDHRELDRLSEKEWEQLAATLPCHTIKRQAIEQGLTIAEALTDITGIFASRSELKKLARERAVLINRTYPIEDITAPVKKEWLKANRYMLVQKGRKNFFVIEVE